MLELVTVTSTGWEHEPIEAFLHIPAPGPVTGKPLGSHPVNEGVGVTGKGTASVTVGVSFTCRLVATERTWRRITLSGCKTNK